MQSKTPKFDALLQPILDGLVPHTIKCEWEGKHEYCEGRNLRLQTKILNFYECFVCLRQIIARHVGGCEEWSI
jgi:hypothetical protein